MAVMRKSRESPAHTAASALPASGSAALDRYNAKRHFDITAEPKGIFEKRRNRSALRFVIQQHDASRMHFDFRLELDGVLKSWAVPKGPSLSPTEKRLAVEVEDHPMDYRSFEGVIPEGQYGGGRVIVWDEGTWEPTGDPHFGLQKGHLSFSLAGQKTNGHFSLVRIRQDRSGNKKTNWLLIKSDDEFARTGKAAEITSLMPESIQSGVTVGEIAKSRKAAVWNSRERREVTDAKMPKRSAAKSTPSFTEMTRDGALRHPSFRGLRHDKSSTDVIREHAVSPKAVNRGSGRDSSLDGVIITHPDRMVDDQSGLTKGALAAYYQTVSQWFLQYARDRPMALVRCPQGGAHQCFFQKNAMPGLSKEIQRGKAGGQGILSIRSAKGIYELVQFNAMEFHGWGASKPSLGKPNWIIFDLDPDESLPFAAVVDSALEIRDALQGVGLTSFVKTTGGKGLHVTVPLRPKLGWEDVKAFTKRIAESLAAQKPDRYVAVMSKTKRRGKIFIDYLRNGEGSTAVLPYSSRARPGATVAVPTAWKDLKHIDPRDFRVENVAQWLGKRRSDPWADFLGVEQALPELK